MSRESQLRPHVGKTAKRSRNDYVQSGLDLADSSGKRRIFKTRREFAPDVTFDKVFAPPEIKGEEEDGDVVFYDAGALALRERLLNSAGGLTLDEADELAGGDADHGDYQYRSGAGRVYGYQATLPARTAGGGALAGRGQGGNQRGTPFKGPRGKGVRGKLMPGIVQGSIGASRRYRWVARANKVKPRFTTVAPGVIRYVGNQTKAAPTDRQLAQRRAIGRYAARYGRGALGPSRGRVNPIFRPNDYSYQNKYRARLTGQGGSSAATRGSIYGRGTQYYV